MPLQFRSPIVFVPTTYKVLDWKTKYGEDYEGEKPKWLVEKVEDWYVKLQSPIIFVEREFVFNSEVSEQVLDSKIKEFLIQKEKKDINVKCICGMKFWPGTRRCIRRFQCPALLHIKQPLCCICMLETGSDTCGSYNCGNHPPQPVYVPSIHNSQRYWKEDGISRCECGCGHKWTADEYSGSGCPLDDHREENDIEDTVNDDDSS